MENSGREMLRLVRTVAWRCGFAFKAGASKEKLQVSAELQKPPAPTAPSETLTAFIH
jgi:hypothetical protein